MTPHRISLEQAIARLLDEWQAPEAEVKAAELLVLIKAHGWRPDPALTDQPRAGSPGDPVAGMAALRQALHTPEGNT